MGIRFTDKDRIDLIQEWNDGGISVTFKPEGKATVRQAIDAALRRRPRKTAARRTRAR